MSKLEIIPLDTECFSYNSNFLSESESSELFEYLLNNCDWEEREIVVYGKKVMQPRLVCWFGDEDYTYSYTTFEKRQMPEPVLRLKEKIEKFANAKFNSVLINLYRDGNDYTGLHSDDERGLGPRPTIASISLGEVRDLVVRSKFDKKKSILSMENGSLLLMFGDSQRIYRHEVPKSKKVMGKRINLTFRFVS